MLVKVPQNMPRGLRRVCFFSLVLSLPHKVKKKEE